MPKSRKLRLTLSARRDIEDIGEYSRQEWGERQRRNYLSRINEVILTLRENPGIGVRRDDCAPGLRSYPVDGHLVFYEDSGETITIVRLLHRRMDPAQHFGDPLPPDFET